MEVLARFQSKCGQTLSDITLFVETEGIIIDSLIIIFTLLFFVLLFVRKSLKSLRTSITRSSMLSSFI